jgi:hypothetical protein
MSSEDRERGACWCVMASSPCILYKFYSYVFFSVGKDGRIDGAFGDLSGRTG